MEFTVFLELMIALQFVTLSAAVLTDEVPLVATHPGEEARVMWKFARSTTLGEIHRILIDDLLECDNPTPYLYDYSCNEHNGRSSLAVEPPEARKNVSLPVKALGFALQNVTVADAKTYRIRIHQLDSVYTGSGVIYVYQRPGLPIITVGDRTTSSTNVTLFCSAMSLSQPTEYHRNITMHYAWNFTIPEPEITPENDRLTIQHASVVASPVAIISCTAREAGSGFISDAATLDSAMLVTSRTSQMNGPAVALGVVLIIVVALVAAGVEYLWYTGRIHWKRRASTAHADLQNTADGTGAHAQEEAESDLTDDALADDSPGQYGNLVMRDSPPPQETQYEALAPGGRRSESCVYENVRK